MAKLAANKQINGTFGSVWVNNEKWLDIEEFEALVKIKYDDVDMAEDLATYQKMMGYGGEGKMVTKKVYSRGANLLADAVKTGILPEVKIIGKLADPDSFGSERVALEHVTFDEFTLLKFEQKKRMTEELPFKFATYEPIDKITA